MLTFGGSGDYKKNIYVLNIDTYAFYKSKIKLKFNYRNSGVFLDRNKYIHIFGGEFNRSHYIIPLRHIIFKLNIFEINIIINYLIKIYHIQNLKWVRDLNKIILNFFG